MPAITTIAGRHAADRARAVAANRIEIAQDHARAGLDLAMRFHGLRTVPHFDPDPVDDRVLWINCRVGSVAADHALVYAVLDELGWRQNAARLSRHNARFDIVRLAHGPTAATVTVIIKMPTSEAPQWDPAA
jgi:hypothetical protein